MNLNYISLARSWHHAILYWLVCQHNRPKYYFPENSKGTRPNKFYNIQYSPDTLIISPNYTHSPISQDDFSLIKSYYDDPNKNFVVNNDSYDINHALGKHTLPPQLQDLDLQNVIMIRDAYNMAASYLKINLEKSRNHPNLGKMIQAWKTHAREALGKTNNLPTKQIILYNRWTSSQDYRASICRKFNLQFTDHGRYRVPSHASGSSFDGTIYDYVANEMQTDIRYKELISHGVFKQYIDDEVIDLVQKLFRIYPRDGFLAERNPWWIRLRHYFSKG